MSLASALKFECQLQWWLRDARQGHRVQLRGRRIVRVGEQGKVVELPRGSDVGSVLQGSSAYFKNLLRESEHVSTCENNCGSTDRPCALTRRRGAVREKTQDRRMTGVLGARFLSPYCSADGKQPEIDRDFRARVSIQLLCTPDGANLGGKRRRREN